MKIQRRNFIKKTLAGTASVSIAGLFPGLFLQGCKQKPDSNQLIMKKLILKEIKHKAEIDLDLAEQLLESNAEFQLINTINWTEFPYKPEVKFKIAYCQDQILLKYYVTEENILARQTEANSMVHTDSCVEFFISPKKGEPYYNFEFNCIGTIKLGYGQERANRVLINPEILKQIKIRSSLGSQPFEEKTGGHTWEMMISIPKECLSHDENISLKGLKANANFYKCGDDTSKPHFVTWNAIGTENPDYHQPSFFGEISFE